MQVQSTQSVSTPLLAKPGIIQTTATTSNDVTISWTGNANTYTIERRNLAVDKPQIL